MCNNRRIAIVGFIAILSVVFIGLPALPKQSDDEQPGKSSIQLIVTPAEATLTGGQRIQFSAQAKNGVKIDMSGVNVEWKVMGNIGSITSDGWFTASDKPGIGMVRASARIDNKQLPGYALVKIAEGETPPGTGNRIVVIVKPGTAVLSMGKPQTFTADPAGETQWRVVPPRIGSINQDGVFIAGQSSGKGIVIATVQTADGKGTGRASVLVGDEDISSSSSKLKLNITPKHARVDNGGSTNFEVKANRLDSRYLLEWEVSPARLGRIEDKGDKVSFIAGYEEGRALVTVKLRTETEIGMDWATVDVGKSGKSSSANVKILVVPEEASIKVSGSIPFNAYITGDELARPAWSVAPKRIGKIDENGLFTATAPGWGLVIARLDSAGRSAGVGQAKIFVGTDDASLAIIAILPQTAEAHIGGEPVRFAAQVRDMQGSFVNDAKIHWKVIPSSLGSIDQTGLFTSGNKPGHALITAKIEGLKGSGMAQARVNVIGTTSHGRPRVSVSGPESLSVGASYNYTASVRDASNSPVSSDAAEFKWRVVPANLGTVTGNGKNATFVTNKAGRGVIIVEVKTPQGNGTGRISITIDK